MRLFHISFYLVVFLTTLLQRFLSLVPESTLTRWESYSFCLNAFNLILIYLLLDLATCHEYLKTKNIINASQSAFQGPAIVLPDHI